MLISSTNSAWNSLSNCRRTSPKRWSSCSIHTAIVWKRICGGVKLDRAWASVFTQVSQHNWVQHENFFKEKSQKCPDCPEREMSEAVSYSWVACRFKHLFLWWRTSRVTFPSYFQAYKPLILSLMQRWMRFSQICDCKLKKNSLLFITEGWKLDKKSSQVIQLTDIPLQTIPVSNRG